MSDDESDQLELNQIDRENNLMKRFFFRVDKIQMSLEAKVKKCFIEFEVGGITKEEATE
jgi:hypothetical protein